MSLQARLPVVCIPGIRGDGGIFRAFADQVESSARGIMLCDLPPGAPALAASRLTGLPHRFHVVTGSYGGLVARHLPSHRMASLACIATLPHPRHLQAGMARQARWICRLPDATLGPLYARHSRRSMRDEGVPDDLLEDIQSQPLAPTTLRGRLRAVFAGHHGRPPELPTLWLHGERDPQVVWTKADVRAACPWAELSAVPGGHFPHASHPAELHDLLEPWWTRAEQAPHE